MSGLAKKLSWYLLPLVSLLLLALLLGYWVVATEKGSDWTLRTLTGALPQDIALGEISGDLASGLRIRDLRLRQPGLELTVTRVDGRWDLMSLLGGEFQLRQLHVADVLVVIREQPEDDTSAPWPSLGVPFPVAVEDLAVTGIILQQGDGPPRPLGDLIFGGRLTPLHYHIQRLDYQHPQAGLTLSGRLGTGFPYKHKLTIDWTATLGERNFSGEGTLNGALTGTQLEHRLAAPAPVATDGQIGMDNREALMDLAPRHLHFDLTSQWPEVAVAAGDQPLVSSGQLTLAGNGEDFAINAQAQLEAAAADSPSPVITFVPEEPIAQLSAEFLPAALTLQARGSVSGLTVERAVLTTANGEGTVAGDLQWSDGLTWDLTASARQLSLAPLLPQWPAVLSGTVASNGSAREDHYSAWVGTDDIEGTIHGLALQARLSAALQPGQIQLEALEATVGSNKIAAEGTIGTDSRLHWDIEAPNLGALGVGLTGSVSSQGSVSGDLDQPELDAVLSGEELGFQQWSLGAVRATLRADANRQLSIEAKLDGLVGPGIAGGDARLTGEGALDNHRLRLSFASDGISAALAARGAYEDRGWGGTITELTLSTPYTGEWRQSGSTPLTAGPEAVQLDGLCLTQDESELCATTSYGEGLLEATGELTGVPLSRLEYWLPDRTAMSGTVNGEFALSQGPNGPRGRVTLRTREGELAYRHGDDDGKRYRHGLVLGLEGTLGEAGLSADATLVIDDTAALAMNLTTGLSEDAPLSGSATLAMDNLRWLEAFTTLVERPAGTLRGDITLSGTRQAPQLAGQVALSNMSARLPLTGITLKEGKATLDVTPGGDWQLTGSVASGEGLARISGEGLTSDLAQGNLALTLTGEAFTLVDLPDTRVQVSPDLRFDRSDAQNAVTGTLHVPSADITLKALPPGAISVSADEVLEPPLDEDPSEATFSARVTVSLGDDVHIQGYGLDTYLAGQLTLRQRTSGATTARGRIELRNGTFEGYGQDLKITYGYMIFQGNLENPGVSIQAVRETPTATAGLRISGTLRDFETEVFSDPSLPPTDALVLLVTGKMPNSIDQSEANMAINAATALGLSQSDRITSRLQSSFGLDVLTLEGGETYEDSSLVVGKQLTPKLFVSYVQNLFSPSSSFILQYQLTDRLGLKAESGEAHSLDLRYRIEH